MRIIALYGKGNVGKTTTIKKLLEKILYSLPAREDVLSTSLNGDTIDELIADLFARDTADSKTNCYAVVKINGRLIGITTYGDSKSSMEGHFERFTDCDLCFCATRMRGSSCDLVYQKANGDLIVWYKHTKLSAYKQNTKLLAASATLASRIDAANDSMANLLYKELEVFLSEGAAS